MKNKPKNKEIFITDISFDVVEEDLEKLFSVCGKVLAIRMLTDAKSGKFSGRAFIRMSTEAEAKDAINTLDGALLINRCIGVEAARQKLETEPVAPAVVEKPKRRRPPRTRGSKN